MTTFLAIVFAVFVVIVGLLIVGAVRFLAGRDWYLP